MHRKSPEGFGHAVHFIWAELQAKALVLDPFATKFHIFEQTGTWVDHALDRRDLTRPSEQAFVN